jgi:hypothetical protein
MLDEPLSTPPSARSVCGGHSVLPKGGTWNFWKQSDRRALSRSPSHAVQFDFQPQACKSRVLLASLSLGLVGISGGYDPSMFPLHVAFSWRPEVWAVAIIDSGYLSSLDM